MLRPVPRVCQPNPHPSDIEIYWSNPMYVDIRVRVPDGTSCDDCQFININISGWSVDYFNCTLFNSKIPRVYQNGPPTCRKCDKCLRMMTDKVILGEESEA